MVRGVLLFAYAHRFGSHALTDLVRIRSPIWFAGAHRFGSLALTDLVRWRSPIWFAGAHRFGSLRSPIWFAALTDLVRIRSPSGGRDYGNESDILGPMRLILLILIGMVLVPTTAIAAPDCRENSLAEARLPVTWKSRRSYLKVGIQRTKSFVLEGRKYMLRYGGDAEHYHRAVVAVRAAEMMWDRYLLCAAAYYLQIARTSLTYAMQKADTSKPAPLYKTRADNDDGLFKLAYERAFDATAEEIYNNAAIEVRGSVSTGAFYDPQPIWKLD